MIRHLRKLWVDHWGIVVGVILAAILVYIVNLILAKTGF